MLTLALALFLLFIPTLFQLEPSALKWSHWVRWPLLGAWAAVAVGVIVSEVKRDERLTQISDAHRSTVRQQRQAATNDVLEALLCEGTRGFPPEYTFTVYVHDREADVLQPIWPRLDLRVGDRDPRVFAPGHGATGSAWAKQQTFVVTGDAVTNADHGLTEAQQQFFSGCCTAAATPIWGDSDEPFGVLTALSSKDDRFLDDEARLRDFSSLATTVGVVLQSIPDPRDLW